LCARGNTLAYRTFPGADHNTPMKTGAAAAQEWLGARFAGKKAENECAALRKRVAQ
jgi:hypothetical protein